ncbi:MAG: reverse transcriptase family protein, partial [Candidatus Thiodiazotropha sp.]
MLNVDTLDLFLLNNPTLLQNITISPGISDHDIVSAEVYIKPQYSVQKPRMMHVYKRADWEGLDEYMLDFRRSFMEDHESKSLNQLWLGFKTALQSGIDKYVPSKAIRSKSSLPWITQDIRRCMHKRDSLYQKYKQHRRLKDRLEFLDARHLVKQKLKQAHDRYILEILGLCEQDEQQPEQPGKTSYCSKKLFSLLKNAKKDSQGVAPLSHDGILHTENTEKADILNAQFQSVFTPRTPLRLSQLAQMVVQDQIDEGVISPASVPEQNVSSFSAMSDIYVSENGILKLLKDLNPHKAAGPDELKPLVLQRLRETLAPMIQVIFQRSLTMGQVPRDWNDANVCPLFKKGDSSLASNYRPISLTCILCKCLEHIVASNLVSHLDSRNILFDLQHGFRAKRSCETQLTMLVEDLAREAISGGQTDLVLLDFSKAFD